MPSELAEFRQEVSAWFADNRPAEPDFLLPETFMEVGTDAQIEYLREWQAKVYEAGYLGMSWPAAYGGGDKPQVMQDIVTAEMARQKTPFMMNTIGLNWAGPLILKSGVRAFLSLITGRISAACKPGPCVMATTTLSTAARSGQVLASTQST